MATFMLLYKHSKIAKENMKERFIINKHPFFLETT